MIDLNRTILNGDVVDRLKDIEDETIDCIITSPPYWKLRDYDVKGQFGLEADYKDYLKKLREIMDECKRVLKKTGSCWINIGDKYGSDKQFEKTRIGIPERFYIQCIDDGWLARNYIPWVKPNAMPEPAKDRFSNRWESLFFFTKSKKYFFNLDKVREASITVQRPSKFDNVEHEQSKLDGGVHVEKLKNKYKDQKNAKAFCLTENNNNRKGRGGNNVTLNNRNFLPTDRKYKDDKETKGKNPGDVFSINTASYPGAHFATFPLKLPEKILKCACPDETCTKCGMPRFPITKASDEYQKILDEKVWQKEKGYDFKKTGNGLNPGSNGPHDFTSDYIVTGFTKCDCNVEFTPGIVLDIFFGSGTTGVAAEKLGLRWCGIELNQDYIVTARKRLELYKSEKIGEY